MKRSVYASLYSNDELALSQIQPFAEGGNRLCYVHPKDKNLCIKVLKPDSIQNLRARRSFVRNYRPDHCFDDNVNEFKAYQQIAIVKNKANIFDHIPRCYGWQLTDIGMGLVSDYYTDDNQKPCQTLRQYLVQNGYDKAITDMLQVLASYLRQTGLLTKHLLTHNMIVAQDGRLKIIDGLGISSAFNTANFNRKVRRHYIERRIARLLLRVQWESSGRVGDWKEVLRKGKLKQSS